MLSPISPHITEELYQLMFADDKPHESIHVSQWPIIQKEFMDEEAEKSGDLIVSVMGEIRRDKAEHQKPLNEPIKKLTFYSVENLDSLSVLSSVEEDLSGTLKILQMDVQQGKRKGRAIKGVIDLYFDAEY